ncbi:MAG: thioredoxin domain-containing protein [Candidatus Peribacter sp.]|nr:thioredoxin domain-containing protein [Candidatus Peribacter sp.]
MMESQDRTKVWFVVALCLLVLIGGYFFANWLIGGQPTFHGASPEQPPAPLIAPAAQPTLEKFEDVAQYTGDKPLPAEPSPYVFLTDIEADEHILGDPGTKIIVVEYAALTSLYTQLVHPKMHEFFEKNKDRIHWVFRHYPASNNENDYRSGMATECVAAQLGNDAFWAYLDLLMKQTGSPLPLNILLSTASTVGADTAKLQTCIEQKELYDLVIDDKAAAETDSQIYVAPSFIFLNRETNAMRIVEGLNTLQYMQAVLDDVSR